MKKQRTRESASSLSLSRWLVQCIDSVCEVILKSTRKKERETESELIKWEVIECAWITVLSVECRVFRTKERAHYSVRVSCLSLSLSRSGSLVCRNICRMQCTVHSVIEKVHSNWLKSHSRWKCVCKKNVESAPRLHEHLQEEEVNFECDVKKNAIYPCIQATRVTLLAD